MMKKLDFSKTSGLIQISKKNKIDSKNILNRYNHIFHHFLIYQK